MHDPREPHYALVKCILWHLRGTLDFGLQLHRTSVIDLVAYSDADWAGCPDTRRSTSGYGVFLGDNLVSWSSKRQQTVSCSSAEAKYRVVANAFAETTWLVQLLGELHCPVQCATLVYCENVSAIYLSTNAVQHQRTKHIEIDLHFVVTRLLSALFECFMCVPLYSTLTSSPRNCRLFLSLFLSLFPFQFEVRTASRSNWVGDGLEKRNL